MSEQESLDIGKVIGLIMENPALIEQISNLAKGRESSAPEEVKKESVSEHVPITEEATQVNSQPTYVQPPERINRAHLLGALKPYVSKERAKAIDSMISIADILDMMKPR